MIIYLEKIDAAPLFADSFSSEFSSWISNIVDTLNESLTEIQENFNFMSAPAATTAEITAAAPDAKNGSIWYCTDSVPPNIVLKIDDNLVQLNTSPFP